MNGKTPIALELEEEHNQMNQRAIDMIRRSSLIDFEDDLRWAQWCRAVATEAYLGDSLALDALAGTVKAS